MSTLYIDSLHPNTAGYTQAGELWSLPLMTPQDIQISQSSGTVTLNWNNLSTYNSQINGYDIEYGTSTNDMTTLDIGNVTTANITGLTNHQSYYFAISGYYKDATSTTINQTAYSQLYTILLSPAVIVSSGGGITNFTPPTIILSGQNPLTIIAGSAYRDPGADAFDSTDNTITSKIATVDNVNSEIPGTYTVTYSITDSNGNRTTETRIVNVVDRINGDTPSSVLSSSTVPVIQGQNLSLFNKDLSFGQTNADVKRLQIFLNQDTDRQVANTGPGSRGEETDFFGVLTKAAVIKFQEKYAKDILSPYNLTVGTGFVGEKTLAKMNEIIAGY